MTGAASLNISETRERLSFLCHDLRTFQFNEHAMNRLNTSTALHHIGPPYLPSEHALSLSLSALQHRTKQTDPETVLELETLGQFLERRTSDIINNRQESGKKDFILYTSHDLAPLIQEALGLQRGFDESKVWKKAYKAWAKSSLKIS